VLVQIEERGKRNREMEMQKKISALAAFVLACTPALAQQGTVDAASAQFVDAKGEQNGTAEISPAGKGVLIEAEVSGLPADSWVAFHIHETGTCDHQTGHESAGGHFNPDGREHGFKTANGPHAGDMPNQYVGADGVLRAQVFNDRVSLGDGENGISGRALMVHAKADDYESQPSGAAGDRLACGVIE